MSIICMKNQAIEIVKRLREHGYQAMFAGGCVRDMILGVPPADYDIATNAKPEVVEYLFEKTLSVGKAFGVIIVVLDGYEIEVATFRKDSQESDGRRPDSVQFSSMDEDAWRRDLTINGMFYDPIEDRIYDFVGGQRDIKDRVVRLIGNPEDRISEDKLRMLRVIRFSARLDFVVDPATFAAVKKHAPEIVQISGERIADELQKILRVKHPRQAFSLLFETGLIDHILPEVRAMQGCEQPVDFHPEGDVLQHTLLALDHLTEDASDELRMGVLLHDVGKPPTQTFEDRIRFNEHDLVGKDVAREILKRLKFSTEFSERVLELIGNHMKFMHADKMRTSRLKRFLALPHFDEHMALHRVDCLSSHRNLDRYDFVAEKLKSYEPEEIRPPRIVTGQDLLTMGFKQGPVFKVILTDVEDQQLEGVISSREEALEYVKREHSNKL
jgi:poly(A) polymerase